MARVIVERVFAEPIEPDQLRERLRASAGCLDLYRVRHLRTCLSLDGRRMICEYEAPDAESVRVASTRLGIPYERVWTANVISAEETG
jgi:hypothetical protein